jgi:hypothetical protein
MWLSFCSINEGKVLWLQPAPAVPPKQRELPSLYIQIQHPQPQPQCLQQLTVQKRQYRQGLILGERAVIKRHRQQSQI